MVSLLRRRVLKILLRKIEIAQSLDKIYVLICANFDSGSVPPNKTFLLGMMIPGNKVSSLCAESTSYVTYDYHNFSAKILQHPAGKSANNISESSVANFNEVTCHLVKQILISCVCRIACSPVSSCRKDAKISSWLSNFDLQLVLRSATMASDRRPSEFDSKMSKFATNSIALPAIHWII